MSFRIVCGLLEAGQPENLPPVEARARSLTVSWIRWSYTGPILAGPTVEAIASAAATVPDYDYCFIQAPGHLITERWSPKQEESLEFFAVLADFARRTDFSIAADPLRRAVLVNLTRWRAGDRRYTHAFEPAVQELMVDPGPSLTGRPEFLADLVAHTEKSLRGVFPWNFESYDDVEVPPAFFCGPVSRLYSVAAGLKPNRILETHGFDDNTEVVFFDYSSRGLGYRKLLLAEWDGRNYPAFLRRAASILPADTHWAGVSVSTEEGWADMERLWNRELDRWGGASGLALHWQKYRTLRHRFVEASVLSGQETILAAIDNRPASAIWWSNAFATVYSGWHCTPEEKRRIYEAWVDSLAARCPDLLVYGSDHSNSGVNDRTVAQYRQEYLAVGGDPLGERKLRRHEVRF